MEKTKKIAEEEAKEETSETQTLVERAEAAAERIEKVMEEHKDMLARDELARAKEKLGGRATASEQPVKKEETPKEYKDRIMRGG